MRSAAGSDKQGVAVEGGRCSNGQSSTIDDGLGKVDNRQRLELAGPDSDRVLCFGLEAGRGWRRELGTGYFLVTAGGCGLEIRSSGCM